jgi:hypothetical protein
MWVDPVGVLHRLVKGSAENALQPHGQPIFFAGQLFSEHAPGPFFYPVTLAFDTSFITLTLALVGVGHYTIWRRRTRPPLDGVAFWLLMAYAACLTLGMSLAGKQVGGRYLLPVHLVLELAAAIGLVGLVYLATRSAGRGRRWARPLFSVGTIVLVVLLQALVALSYAPDYGAHHNHLLGGNRVADEV